MTAELQTSIKDIPYSKKTPNKKQKTFAANPSTNASFSKTKESSEEKILLREIVSTASRKMSTSMSTTCKHATKDDINNGVGLWQWVLETEDHSTSAFTSHFVCRFGKEAKTAPHCNWMDCRDKNCYTCKGDVPGDAKTPPAAGLAQSSKNDEDEDDSEIVGAYSLPPQSNTHVKTD